MDKVSAMIECMALDFYGKSDDEAKQKVTEDVLAYLEKEISDKYVTREEFKKSQSYMTDPETGAITVLRMKDNMVYAVSIDPNENETNNLDSMQSAAQTIY